MEFFFDIEKILNVDSKSGIGVIDSYSLSFMRGEEKDKISILINKFSSLSLSVRNLISNFFKATN